jgi:hypothetical protein
MNDRNHVDSGAIFDELFAELEDVILEMTPEELDQEVSDADVEAFDRLVKKLQKDICKSK